MSEKDKKVTENRALKREEKMGIQLRKISILQKRQIGSVKRWPVS